MFSFKSRWLLLLLLLLLDQKIFKSCLSPPGWRRMNQIYLTVLILLNSSSTAVMWMLCHSSVEQFRLLRSHSPGICWRWVELILSYWEFHFQHIETSFLTHCVVLWSLQTSWKCIFGKLVFPILCVLAVPYFLCTTTWFNVRQWVRVPGVGCLQDLYFPFLDVSDQAFLSSVWLKSYIHLSLCYITVTCFSIVEGETTTEQRCLLADKECLWRIVCTILLCI